MFKKLKKVHKVELVQEGESICTRETGFASWAFIENTIEAWKKKTYMFNFVN